MARVMSRSKLDELRRSLLARLNRGADPCELFEEASQVRSGMVAALDGILSTVDVEGRSHLRRSEDREFTELRDLIQSFDPTLDLLREKALRANGRHPEQLAALRAASEAEANAARAANTQGESNVTTSRLTVKSEPTTYGPESRFSYFHDLTRRQSGDSAAARRLERHAAEIAVDAPNEVRAGSRADGAGGEFVPPLWLLSQYAGLARPGRVTADLCQVQQLPGGTDSIQVPKITQGTLIAAQTADNATISNQDLATSTVTTPVQTYAGYYDASVQLYEQSPIAGGLDQVIFQDLVKAHAQAINGAVLYGTGANGQVEGILTNTSTTTVTYTSTSPTAAGLYSKIASAISSVTTSRYEPPTAIVMHPRRWFWLASQVDSNGRPIVVPTADGNQSVNSMSSADGVSFEKPVGSIMGLPVWIDPMIPTNLGSGSEDRIIVAKFTDAMSYEGGVRAEVFRDVLSSSLGVRFRLYSYYATTGVRRYPGSFSVIGGTGLTATV